MENYKKLIEVCEDSTLAKLKERLTDRQLKNLEDLLELDEDKGVEKIKLRLEEFEKQDIKENKLHSLTNLEQLEDSFKTKLVKFLKYETLVKLNSHPLLTTQLVYNILNKIDDLIKVKGFQSNHLYNKIALNHLDELDALNIPKENETIENEIEPKAQLKLNIYEVNNFKEMRLWLDNYKNENANLNLEIEIDCLNTTIKELNSFKIKNQIPERPFEEDMKWVQLDLDNYINYKIRLSELKIKGFKSDKWKSFNQTMIERCIQTEEGLINIYKGFLINLNHFRNINKSNY